MTAVITGIGWVTAAGMGRGKDRTRLEMPAASLPEITRQAVFNAPYPRFGRMDRYCRLGLAAIAFALRDAALEKWSRKRNVGIIASTVYGCLNTDVDYCDTIMSQEGRLASPHLFAYTLPNCFLGEAAIRFGLTGSGFIVSAPSASELWCLRMALTNLSGGEFETVLCGICDLARPPFFPEADPAAPGALFLVIEALGRTDRTVYGALRLNRDGTPEFNGRPVKNLATLAREGLNAAAARRLPAPDRPPDPNLEWHFA
ncbi:MAG: hypothetical protein JSW39_11070 [Desulfobacterales bacterium]|nr:MAG: hypothetical protein JSW39_11070 [Desulfobacterales bacterium]